VVKIRDLVAKGLTQTEVARRFGIDQSTVSIIITRKTWNHI
jgi:transcriptional regulator with XRE-family HTH domain